jgi:hypothetical protein
MAANRKQGNLLTLFLAGFTAFVAGLILFGSHGALAVILTVGGLILLIISLAGFRRIKHLEYTPSS